MQHKTDEPKVSAEVVKPEKEHVVSKETQELFAAFAKQPKNTTIQHKTELADNPDGSVTVKVELFGNAAHVLNLVKGAHAMVLAHNGEQLDVLFTLNPAVKTEAPHWTEKRSGVVDRRHEQTYVHADGATAKEDKLHNYDQDIKHEEESERAKHEKNHKSKSAH